ILAWRAGRTALLQSSLTRAVVFSGMTTATAFGSLWLARDPGTSSMGRLMTLALACTMGAPRLFPPALVGPPPKTRLPPPPGRNAPVFDLPKSSTDAREPCRMPTPNPSLALNNLRTFAVMVVLAVHASSAYLGSSPASPFRFDDPPFRWRALPIIDSDR